MVAQVRACWSHVTPKNVAISVAATGGGVNLVGFGLGFWSSSTPFIVVSAVSVIFAAFLAGTSAKYMPTGSLEKVVNRLGELPAQFTAILRGDGNQSPSLDQVVAALQSADLSNAQEALAIKALLEKAKTSLDQQTAEIGQINGLNNQYKALIANFLPLLDQLGKDNTGYAMTAQKITSLLGNVKTKDLESQELHTAAAELPQAVSEGQKLLVQQGQQLAALQKEIEEMKATGGDLNQKIAENQRLLEEIAAARKALADETARFKEAHGSQAA